MNRPPHTRGAARPLFADGKPSEVVQSALQFCAALQRDYNNTHEFVEQLSERGLLIPNQAEITLPSGEVRRIQATCRATIGMVGNSDHNNITLGKAGRSRWLGRRPHVRGVAMNPVDHPMGGGEGRTSGGRNPCSPTGKLAKGGKTRRRRKPSNSAIIRRRKSVRYGQLKI